MMKVLLIRPPAPNALSFTKVLDNEPLELEYLHTALQGEGHEDYIYDGLVEDRSVREVIRNYEPQVVAITGYITQEILMKKYAKQAKEINPHITTIIGGVHAQLNYERFYDEAIDYITRSESMEVFIEIIKAVESLQGDKSHINGLCYQEEGNFKVNELKPICIDSLPIPDRSHFYKYKSYYRYLDLTEVATVKTAFSCPYGCNFCYCTLLNGGKYVARDLSLVIEELKTLDCQNVQIVDDDFLVDKKRLWQFIELIKAHQIKKTYICYARADFVSKNPEIIKALADIGFKYFLVGLEAVSDEELTAYNKETSVDVNRRCVEVIHQTSASCIGLMIAPIEATKAYFKNLYKWIVDNNLKYVTVSIFTPIPGTKLYEDYKDKITSKNIEDWDFLHLVLEPTHLTRAQFYKEFYKLFIKLYHIARRTGIYSFMDLKFYKKMLSDYLKRQIRDKN